MHTDPRALEKRLICQSEIKKRGWTDTMVRDFLGEPDELRRNPHYKCAGKMRLFFWSRVVLAERTAAWEARRTLARQRRSAAIGRGCHLAEIGLPMTVG